jgi:hypothetical protein
LCEAWVGYDDEEVYPGAVLRSGKLVLSIGFGGVAVSADGCGFTAWLPSELPFVADVRVRSDAPDAVVALEGRVDGERFVNQLWQSIDDAKTWQPLGPAFAPDTQALSFAVSNTGELYVATSGPAGAELLRSDDSAERWSRTTITPELGAAPRVIGAHEAAGSAHLFVMLDYAQAYGLSVPGDRALMSLDRGASFVPLLEAADDLSAWSLSADGERLVVGGEDGIHLLPNAASAGTDAVMMQISESEAHALAWGSDGRLYFAGHEAIDGFSVGVSTDDGQTFSPLFALCQVDGPLACPAETSVGALCLSAGETGWDVRKEVADSNACTEGSAAGTGGSSNTAPEAPDQSGGATSTNRGTSDSASDAGCSASHHPANHAAAFTLALAAGALARRKRGVRVAQAPTSPARGRAG